MIYRILLFFSIFLMSACRSSMNVEYVYIPVKDSTYVKEIVVEKTVVVKDTFRYEIPKQKDSNVSSEHSFLENDFSYSSAFIDSLGLLHHDLETKDEFIDIPYDKERVERDSNIVVYKEKPVPYEKPYPVEVEKKLTWWEKVSVKYFNWVLGIAIMLSIFICRKKIVWIIKKLFNRQ